MPFKDILGDIVPRYIRLSKTEARILGTLIVMKSGNAYSSWKTSGLKHYPTVLRTLKKLEEKRLVQAMSEKGTRGEIIYAPTLVGVLAFYIFNEEEKKIVDMVTENSKLFREFSKIEKKDDLPFYAVQDILLDMYRKREPRGIDEAVRERLEGDLKDHVFNILDKDSREWIKRLSKIESMRELALREIEINIDWCKKEIEALKKLKKRLTTSNR